jgi:cellulose synthase/poly-beta-1,6-N-acetylglucosamine synthase-like glycosyltransferase
MKKLPKIFVLVPAFNEENNLTDAVESILRAKYPKKEIIIGVDDGNDRTLEIARELKKKYKIISIVHHKKRVGTTANMNSMLKKAKGEIILKFDSDMRVGNPKRFFYNIKKHFEDKNVGALVLWYNKINDKKIRREVEKKKENFLTRGEYAVYKLVNTFRMENLPINKIPTFPIDVRCFRKSLVKEIDNKIIHDDAFFAYKVLEKGYKVKGVTDIVLVHLGTPMSITGLFNTRIKGRIGWKELSKKYPIDLNKYYFSLFVIFLKNIRKFSLKDIAALFWWSLVSSASILLSHFKKDKTAKNIWKSRR